ncbi:MAG: VWA domain-containing protein [Acidobacteriota bacterium]
MDVSLVLLEAIVHDKKRNHVRGLKKEDFQVFEEGKEQKIAVFEEVDLTRKEAFEEAVESKAPGALKEDVQRDSAEISSPLEHKGRVFLFLFDVYNSPSALFVSQAKKAVRDFMETRFNPGDIAAIYELTPELMMTCEFTSDWREVIDSLEKVRFFPGKNIGEQLLEEAANFRIPSKEDSQWRIAQAAALKNQIFRQERQNFYQNLGSLSFTLAEFPGKRMIVLFSGGFPMTVPGDINDDFGGFTPAFRDLIANMAKNNVSIYTFDVGETLSFADATQSVDYRIALGKLGLGENFLEEIGLGGSFFRDSTQVRKQILAVFGNETGGAFMINPDYKEGLASLDDDTNHYYLIGYYPAEKVEKERYRRIKIKVSMENTTIISRRGRFATKGEHDNKKKIAPESTLQDVRKLQMDIKRSEDTVIPCAISTIFSPAEEGKTRVTFAIQILDRIEPFINEQGNGIVDMTLRILASSGEVTIGSIEKDIKAILKPEGASSLSGGFRILEYMDLVPAIYDFQVFLRLNGMGKYMLWSKALEVHSFKSGDLDLGSFSFALAQSSPLLFDSYADEVAAVKRPEEARETKEATETEKMKEEAGETRITQEAKETRRVSEAGQKAVSHPFELRNGFRIVPVAIRNFRKGESIYLFYKIMNAQRLEGNGKPDLDLDFKLLEQEGSQPPAGLKPYADIQATLLYFGPEKEGTNLDALIELKIPGQEYNPGFYRLRITVKDRRSGSTITHEEKIQLL